LTATEELELTILYTNHSLYRHHIGKLDASVHNARQATLLATIKFNFQGTTNSQQNECESLEMLNLPPYDSTKTALSTKGIHDNTAVRYPSLTTVKADIATNKPSKRKKQLHQREKVTDMRGNNKKSFQQQTKLLNNLLCLHIYFWLSRKQL
jgi:hypothetical protein